VEITKFSAYKLGIKKPTALSLVDDDDVDDVIQLLPHRKQTMPPLQTQTIYCCSGKQR
jgi:hypothetical protein